MMGIASAAWCLQSFYGYTRYGVISDFDISWQAATALLNGGDPYVLMGPEKVFHLDFPVIYPATAFVVAIPFTLLPQAWGTMTFVFLSTFLMAYGMTADGWHRLPIFASISFLTAALLGQWSMLMTAILFLPWLAIFTSVKPGNFADCRLLGVTCDTNRRNCWNCGADDDKPCNAAVVAHRMVACELVVSACDGADYQDRRIRRSLGAPALAASGGVADASPGLCAPDVVPVQCAHAPGTGENLAGGHFSECRVNPWRAAGAASRRS